MKPEKAKAQMQFNFARDIKDNKKGFCKYMRDKKNTRENLDPLLNKTRDFVKHNMEKAELLNAFFTTVFINMTSLQECQVPETRGKGWTREDVPLMEDHQVREYLN